MSGSYRVWQKKCDFDRIAAQLHVDPVVVRLMYNRDVPEEQMAAFLHPSAADLHDPHLLPDADRGAGILANAVRTGAAIRIIGDYDADGVCSTYILLKALSAFGADVDYRIPERTRHGYGLHPELIDLALADGRQVLLTCDNGISEAASIARAKAAGMTVIVTDHHNVPKVLPPADAVIDPKRTQPDGSHTYPYTEICGAVVAMKFMQVLYEEMGRSADDVLCYLDMAAFATVCDVMPLRDENRAIVTLGLQAMSHTKNRGLRALMQVNHIDSLKAWHFGFVLGPCVNAAGRLETAYEAMKLLLSDSDAAAERQAAHLQDLNGQRKSMTERGIQQALAQYELQAVHDRVQVIYLPDCPDSIAGIVAGKVREQIYRPVFIVTGREDVLKGSARSIPAYSLFDEMSKVADVFEKYGGHPLAAGFSVRADRLDEMRHRLNSGCMLTDAQMTEVKHIDINMPMSYVSVSLLEQIALLEPHGTGNAGPLFGESKPVILFARRIGREGQYLRFRLRTRRGMTVNAVYFGRADDFLERYRICFGASCEEQLLQGRGRQALSVVYQPEMNIFRGEKQISFRIKDFIFP